MIRLGVRGFKPNLRKAAERIEALRTPEGQPVPANTLADLRRDLGRLELIREQIKEIERARERRLKQAPEEGAHPMLLLLARLKSIGLDTADRLVHEAFYRRLRDRRAVARYGGVTGAPDESGAKRREKGLAKAGNGRVRKAMLQLAWRWIMFQKESTLTQWYQQRVAGAKGDVRKTMIIALARKLLIALWRYVTEGEVPAGAVLRPGA
jgi:transposase